MKTAVWRKYPKFSLLLLTLIPAFIIFQEGQVSWFHDLLLKMGFLGTFIAGMLYSYGFTAASGTALLLLIGKTQNIYVAAVIGGFGSMLSDLLLFEFLRTSLKAEIELLKKERIMKAISSVVPKSARNGMWIVLGAAVIASPFPDEIGVAMLSFAESLNEWKFAIISFVLSTVGIFAVLSIGRAIGA